MNFFYLLCSYIRTYAVVCIMFVEEGWHQRTVAKTCMDILKKNKRVLIVRSLVHNSMHAYILPQATDSKFLRIYCYTPIYERFTSMTVLNYVPSVSLDHVQFFSMHFIFLFFINLFQDLFYLVHPAYLHGNWEVERFFGRCFCCFLNSVTLVITSLMPFGIEKSSLGCTAVPPKDLSSVSVDCNSAGDLGIM